MPQPSQAYIPDYHVNRCHVSAELFSFFSFAENLACPLCPAFTSRHAQRPASASVVNNGVHDLQYRASWADGTTGAHVGESFHSEPTASIVLCPSARSFFYSHDTHGISCRIFTCAALGGPWSISKTNSQGVGVTTYTYSLTHLSSEVCAAGGTCNRTIYHLHTVK